MPLQLYNTLSGKKEDFHPRTAGVVSMYCCGPTVYGLLHVGNFRGAVVYNLLRNWLEKSGLTVQFAYNFTDVDDRIIAKAKEAGVAESVISEKYISEFKRDYGALGLKPHDFNPKVSESLPAIIKAIEQLIANGHAYEAQGEVFYSVRSFEGYGKLSGRKPDELLAGARVEVDPRKRDPLDFSLWKPAKGNEISWPSPWGNGRPGWHIECTAMIQALFGETVDIHGGGTDLIFPHHENEVAQGEGCSHKSYANYWVHNNMFTFGGQKMSKSIGNILSMREFLSQYHPEIYKYLVLSVHYRSLAEFTTETIHQSVQGLARVYSALALAHEIAIDSGATDPEFEKLLSSADAEIKSALDDDLATPRVFATFFNVVRAFNGKVKRGVPPNPKSKFCAAALIQWFQKYAILFALFAEIPSQLLRELDDLLLKQLNLNRAEIDELVRKRQQFRLDKDFKSSDELRLQLTQMGIDVQDTAGGGSHWEVRK